MNDLSSMPLTAVSDDASDIGVGSIMSDVSTPKTPGTVPKSLSRRISWDAKALIVQPTPNPDGRSWVERYSTREATMSVFREALDYGTQPTKTAAVFGRVSLWARKGGEVDHLVWACCCFCIGPCMIEQQREAMEIKLHRWHKERGDASGEPNLHLHRGAGGLCSCRWWPCTRPWLVAQHAGALANFKRTQGLDGWPAGEPWACGGSGGDFELGGLVSDCSPESIEMERDPLVDGNGSTFGGAPERSRNSLKL